MDYTGKRRSLHAAKSLVLGLALYGVYGLYTRLDALGGDGGLILGAGTRAAALGVLRPEEKARPRQGAASRQDSFMSEYYALGRALGERAPILQATRDFVEAANAEYLALLPLGENILRGGRAAAGDAAFSKAASDITRLCLEAARSNAAARDRLLVTAGLAYSLLFILLLLVEWTEHAFICEPYLEEISALGRKIRFYAAALPGQKAPQEGIAGLGSCVELLLADLLASRAERLRLEQEAAARQSRLKIQSRSLELARKKVVALVEDLEKTREELQQEEKALVTTGEKLARSNRELEQFAYVASHDLKEPLRIILSFSALLSKRYSGSLDSDAADFIRYITEAASRSTELISALFDYSKVTYATREFKIVPAMTALQKALFNLKMAIDDKKGRVICDGLPELKMNEFQLIQLFQNLISNSLKFNASPEPEIRIGFSETPAAWTLYFSDNGIGIAPEHFERIFLVFQRLHSQTKYPGTGIGLALCKKIAENHGGKIWVESKPGEGSTFFIELPKQAEPAAAAACAPEPEPAEKANL